MITRSKITRILLDDKTDEEYIFFGIVTTEPDYKLSHLLNMKIKLALKNNKPIEITGTDGTKLSFSRYSYSSESQEINYNLIANRSGKDYLLKKLKKIDFFLQIQSHENYNVEHMTGALREIEKITAVFLLNPREIKDKNLAYLTL
jgi:hypothetical protein